jgi:multiple sugar transport system permease protein
LLSKPILWLLTLPSGMVIAAALLYPLGYAVYLSTFQYFMDQGSWTFVGLGNYADLLNEERFWSSLARTTALVAAAVGLELTIGLLVAYGLYKLRFGARTLNVLIFMPYLVTPVVAALFLKWIFMGRYGLLDALLLGLGVFPPDWLGDPGWARAAAVFADFWQFTPFVILVLYAGLNTVDEALLEAAAIDGAGPWTVLIRIMVPLIMPLIVLVLGIRVMDAFRYFDMIYVLTAGGPGTATETLTIYSYALAFRMFEVGKASALGILTLLIEAALIAMLAAWLYRRHGEAS